MYVTPSMQDSPSMSSAPYITDGVPQPGDKSVARKIVNTPSIPK
jgi:hypothetical protein